jgi:hypothetical protein
MMYDLPRSILTFWMKPQLSEKYLCSPTNRHDKIGGDKRKMKMKRQILAILATVAVITALLTVSALSNEVGYKVSPCDAIDISIENTTVTDFLIVG